MVFKKKTWQEKLNGGKNFPKFLSFDPKFPCGKALAKMGAKSGDRVVLAPPMDVVAVMNRVPEGKLITLHEICRILASKYKADYCCTLTTGIFVMTAANAAEEMNQEGKKNDLPWWRTLKADGFLNEKFPGGVEGQKERLEKEGFSVIRAGKRVRIENLRRYLMSD